MTKVYLDSQEISLSPTMLIGSGGEADIFRIPGGRAAKIFKPPTHQDYEGFPLDQKAAADRIALHQKKLPDFPKNVPDRVSSPQGLLTDKKGKIVGYVMRFLDNVISLMETSDRSYPNNLVRDNFIDAHHTVCQLHPQIILGDFNYLNELVRGVEVYFIDADSYQYGPYLCYTFTDRFVDPLLVRPKSGQEKKEMAGAGSLMLNRPHNENSDWYAFATMLFECLLFVHPYGGVYRPKDPSKRVLHDARPLSRITVFNSEVIYPKKGVHYNRLPDEMLQYFHQLFEKDQRGVFPLRLLEKMEWTKCAACGTEHARAICPECSHIAPAAVKEVTVIRGQVKSTRIFKTTGTILFAAWQHGKLNYLYHENGKFKREDESVVIVGELDPKVRYRVQSEATLMGKTNQLVTLKPNTSLSSIIVDAYNGTLPMFDVNDKGKYWVTNGQLRRDGQFADVSIGDVLEGQTLFWMGQTFGFGFYRAGNIKVAFTFDAASTGLNDSVKLPRMRGQLVDSTCVFSKDRCWFMYTSSVGGKMTNTCVVIKPNGEVEATAEAEKDDGESWLGTIRGKCAMGNFLFAPTDDGIVRVEPNNGGITVTREFPDTEPFVNAGSNLFPADGGLYIVDRNQIQQLTIG